MDSEGSNAVNILLIKLSAIGDVVHTLPSLAALRKLYPKAHITWVIEEAASDLIIKNPYLDRVIISYRKHWIAEFKKGRIYSSWKELAFFLRELRNRPYDIVIDFHGLFKSAILVSLSSGNRKLGYNSLQELSGFFYNEKISEDMTKHAVDRYLDFPRYLGADGFEPEFMIPIDDENRERVHRLLITNNLSGKDRFVSISPNALWKTKLWDEVKFARLCDRINKELKAEIVFTGQEKDTLDRIQTMMKGRAVNLGGQTTLRDLAYLYKHSAVVVTTDSGPMHIAAAVGTPTIALFGPTDPKRTGPYGKGHTVIRKELPCSPCLLKKCDSTICMKDITVDEVFDAVAEKIDKAQ